MEEPAGSHAYQHRSPAVGMDHEESRGVAATAAEAMAVGSEGGTERAAWRSRMHAADARQPEPADACRRGWVGLASGHIAVAAELVARFPWRWRGTVDQALAGAPPADADHDPERVPSPVLARIHILEAVARTQPGSAIQLGGDPFEEKAERKREGPRFDISA